ncbi:hypothetical protein [Bradyrhizobium sp.]|uniref:hypothetical protein n=1 Tax=Bradyrhizobium sp. TaxID=376 RepID=UPI00273713AC|nr:hypothetical protein [Bradyrhizobium sp.]MDP3078674.1 hypothetical protein [Bradyrhizobium sp.]
MRLILAALLLAGPVFADPPAALVRINREVNDRAFYEFYEAKDFRYLKEGDSGNCAAFTWTKFVELVKAGEKPVIRSCTLKSGVGHAFVEVDGWVGDNRWDEPVPIADVGCRD